MIGLTFIAVFLLIALVVVSALGFVFLAVMNGMIGMLAKGGPVFGKLFRTAGVVLVAGILAVASINLASEQVAPNPHIFAFAKIVDSSVSQTSVAVDSDSIGEDSTVDELIQPRVSGEFSAENPDTATSLVSTDKVDLPNWVIAGAAAEGTVSNRGSEYIVLKSDLKVLREEADAQIREQAAEVIRKDFSSHYAADVEWKVPAEVIEDAIRRSYHTTETVPDLENAFSAITLKPEHEMHRVYAQVALSPSLRSAIYPGWRKLVVGGRLVKMGQRFGLVSLVVLSLAMYLRYDRQTSGKKRGRLGLLSLAVLAGGSVVLGALGDTMRSKLSAAKFVEAEYCRDRIDQLDDTVIGLNDGPVFEADDAASKIAIVIDSGQFNRPGVIRRQMADYVESLAQNTKIEIHVFTDRHHSTAGFHGGTNSAKVQHGIEELMARRVGKSAPVSRALETALKSDAQSVFMITEGLANLTDRERRRVKSLTVRSNLVPVSFIKIFDGKPTRFDDALQTLSARSGGYLRLLDVLDVDE
jgi:hypothetical protein